ncbi:hypothetical protein LshimejAT787_1001770 [Lyophyllum shimeji]|uniref:LisH domain-containing protein n=1 Tax=Lyophyllum shimeji TaxID=47721 RepID=A0A9P3UQT3_LYOSH|nr:hypothetical protein LshimejAT787_1001770 [Lyophyllum shimeji]
MATASQTASTQPLPPQNDGSPQTLSWEGEKMFNIYIYDYCFKRGFRKTARELMAEADIAPDSTPPINARQGLLFEWWSVFWVLFTAKANGTGGEDAMLYTQHQANQLLQRQANQRLQAPPGQAPLPGQQPQPGMHHQPGPPMGRLANGVAPRPGMMGFMPNGPMPNGVGPPQGSLQPGGHNSFSMAVGAPQPNGIPGQPGQSSQGGPSAPGPNFQPLLPGQRPSIGGGMPQSQPPQQPAQQRGPNGPFQSPNMAANSPQNPPGQQPPHPQQQLSQPPMGQLGGPSPHLTHMNRGGMLPPNQGMNPMNPQQGPPGQQGNAPPPSQYQRSPSRAATPGQGQGGMMHPSPSIANRPPPGTGQMMPGGMMDANLNNQLMAIPTATLSQIKQELGMDNKDLPSLTSQDKQRILTVYRTRQPGPQQNKPGGGPPDNAAAGPSNQMMQPPNQQQRNNPQQRNPQQQTPQQQQQQQQQQRGKRNSTSPGEEHENLPRNDSSPPDRKRLRRSPMEQPAVPPMNYPHTPQQQPQPHPQQPGGPQMMMGPQGMMVMRHPPNMGMNGGGQQHPGQPPMGGAMNLGGMGMGGQQQMGLPHMGGGGMNPQMGHPGSITPHMQNQQMQAREHAMRQHQQAMLPKGPQQGGLGNMTGNAGSPSSADPSTFNMGGSIGQGAGGPGFGPGPNRMGGAKSMMPPPQSPGMNAPPKDQNAGPGAQNNAKNASQNPSMPANHGSPRNPPPGSNNSGHTPNANGTGPPTPAPGNPQNPNPGGPGQGGLGVGGQNMAPSPSSILGSGGPPMNTSSMGGQPSLGTDMSGGIFSTDFIQSVASSLDEFDTTLFRPDGDINFERDFGQWFNPDDVSGLDMK